MSYTAFDPSGMAAFAASNPPPVEDGWVVVEGSFLNHRLVDGFPVEIPAKPNVFASFDPVSGEWRVSVAAVGESVKGQRNQLLTASDWTQLPDVPLVTKNAWATYRQALRDITEQPGYPLEVNWPVAPA